MTKYIQAQITSLCVGFLIERANNIKEKAQEKLKALNEEIEGKGRVIAVYKTPFFQFGKKDRMPDEAKEKVREVSEMICTAIHLERELDELSILIRELEVTQCYMDEGLEATISGDALMLLDRVERACND